MTLSILYSKYFLVNAFTKSISGGNPAATLLLAPNHTFSTDELQAISAKLAQPVTSFITLPTQPLAPDAITARFKIRWFNPSTEIPICGHGTLAAGHSLFFDVPELVGPNIELIEFESPVGVMTARKTLSGEVEIQLPSTVVQPISEGENKRIAEIIARAVGQDDVVRFIGRGEKGFDHITLVELDDTVLLKDRVVDTEILKETGCRVHVLTSVSSTSEIVFVSRMFAPLAGINEDHVCGSAHCLLTPYWSTKRQEPKGARLQVKQVSARGGDLNVQWVEDEGIVRLRGYCKAVSEGEYAVGGV